MSPAEKAEPPSQPEAEHFPAEAERRRIRLALLDLLSERGYPELDLPALLSRAGLDAAAFERHYESLDACFAELCQGFMREAAERTFAAYAAAPDWRSGMRAQVWESYRFLIADRLRARICVLEVNFGGELVQATRDLFMGAYIELIHLGRHEVERAEQPPRSRAEAIAGAGWEMIAKPIKAGEFDHLLDVAPQVIYMIFLPYLGPEIAQQELRRARREADWRRS